MAALTCVVVLGVVFRKAGAALVWYDEVASILLAWLTFYGACLAALKRAHIGFPQLVEALNPRVQRWVVVVRELIVLGFFVVAGWAGILVVRVLEGTYLVTLPGISTQLTQSVIPVGAVLFIVAELLSLQELRRGRS
jgi:TRAP-type C4-dicarboxylate transport system permease small subunit